MNPRIHLRWLKTLLGHAALVLALLAEEVAALKERLGELDNFTLGLNWHLTPYLRYTANWVHAITDRPATGEFETDFFAMRVGYEF